MNHQRENITLKHQHYQLNLQMFNERIENVKETYKKIFTKNKDLGDKDSVKHQGV